MGCSFFACFRSSKHKKLTGKVQENGSSNPQQQSVVLPLVQDHPQSETLVSPSLQKLQDKTEEELSVGLKKKVTFESNVKTYESVSAEKDTEEGVVRNTEGGKEESSAKTTQSKSFSSEDSSVTSTGSYPSNHRYQNCRDSDEEDEELNDWVDDLSDDDDDGIREERDELGVEFEEDDMAYSKLRVVDDVDHVFAEEVESPIRICEKDVETIGLNPNARDRSVYVHPVLNPVENLSQWKAVKARRRPTLRPQKENNVCPNPESQVAFGVKEVSESDNTPKKSNKEIAVDASLSNWLGSSETTPVNKTTLYAGGSFGTPDRSSSQQGSNSVMSLEDRPILGALTVEEIKQFSATPSPRKSPSKSPDDMPIIGTVGSYWHFAEDSGSASSFKGIPNTTSKYREDRKVNWHTTPFETRLEKAMNRGDVSDSC